jgi:hypothetical protein
MDLREIEWDWVNLAQDRDQCRALVNTVKNLRVPSNAGRFLSICTVCGLSRRAQLHERVSDAAYIIRVQGRGVLTTGISKTLVNFD